MSKLRGGGYSAQVYVSGVADSGADGLQALEGAPGSFSAAGELLLPLQICVQGSFGEDLVTAQLRVWDNRDGSVRSWEASANDPSVPRGASPLLERIRLSGFARDGSAVLGNLNLYLLLPDFTIYAVPEPGLFSSFSLFLAAGWFSRAQSRRRAQGHPRTGFLDHSKLAEDQLIQSGRHGR